MDRDSERPTTADDAKTPDDVAVLYSWANLSGARYRDFSAQRRQYRAEQRRQQAERQHLVDTGQQPSWTPAAEPSSDISLPMEPSQPGSSALGKALDQSSVRARLEAAERERVTAFADHAAAPQPARSTSRTEDRSAAERQAARAHEAELRRRTLVRADGSIPGQTADPYTYADRQERTSEGQQPSRPAESQPATSELRWQSSPRTAQERRERPALHAAARLGGRPEAQDRQDAAEPAETFRRPDRTPQIQSAAESKPSSRARMQETATTPQRTEEPLARQPEAVAPVLQSSNPNAYGRRRPVPWEAPQHVEHAAVPAPAAETRPATVPGHVQGHVLGHAAEDSAPAWLHEYTEASRIRKAAPNVEPEIAVSPTLTVPVLPTPPFATAPSTVADTLQHSRERVASRWYALKEVFGGEAEEASPASTPVEREPGRTPVLILFSLAGGVGKTSLTATLGRALSSLGEKVLLADTTSHGLLPYYFGAHELRPGLVRTFTPPSGSSDAPIYLVNYELEREAQAKEALHALDREIHTPSSRTHRVLVDLSAVSSWTLGSLAQMETTLLIPVAPDMNSIISLHGMDRVLRQAAGAGTPLQPYYLLNQFDPSLPLHRDVREVLRQKLGDRLLPFAIRRASAVSEALAEGMTVLDYAPESGVTEDFFALANWLRRVSAPAASGLRNLRWSER
jgi:cellulose synthase operon protein YhjQ